MKGPRNQGKEHGERVFLFWIRMKSNFFVFLRLVHKNILKQQQAENAAKSTEKDVLELLQLQNVLCPQPRLRQS